MIQHIQKYIKAFLIAMLTFTFACDPNPDIEKIPGDDKEFDPILQLPAISDFAGDGSVIFSIVAWYVEPDGTINMLADYKPQVTYSFIRKYITPDDTKKTDAPMGVPSGTNPYLESISVYITKPWVKNWKGTDQDPNATKHEGMERVKKSGYGKDHHISKKFDEYRNASPPVSFAEIWRKAVALGAPSENVVANITFYQFKGYSFYIPETEYLFEFDLNGDLIEK